MAVKVGRCLLSKRLRENDMSQKDFADAMDMLESQVSDYVRNRKRMSLQTAASAAQVIGCHIDDLYEWIPIKKSERKRRSRRV